MVLCIHFRDAALDLRTKLAFQAAATADEVLAEAARRIAERHRRTVPPARYVLRAAGDAESGGDGDFFYGLTPLIHFGYVQQRLLRTKPVTCELGLVSLSEVLEFLPCHDGSPETCEAKGEDGRVVYVRTRALVGSHGTDTVTSTEQELLGDRVMLKHTHTHHHRLADGRVFTTTSRSTSTAELKQPSGTYGSLAVHVPNHNAAAATKAKRGAPRGIRGLVSKKKIRFQQDGFDLDLTYITKRIIAMGFPSVGTEKLYRNPMSSVEAFFERYHKSHYKVYNLCSERNRQYEPARFGGSQARFPFPDHHAPPLALMMPFCKDVDRYLQEDERNVVAIHCKAGKGRTGTMIAAYMIYGYGQDAEEALRLYGEMRTSNGKGVTIPSQKRYVHYFANLVNVYKGLPPPERCLVFRLLRIFTTPHADLDGGCDPMVQVFQGDVERLYQEKLYDSSTEESTRHIVDQAIIDLPFTRRVVVKGDVKVVVYDTDRIQTAPTVLFQFFFNTSFIPSHNVFRLEKNEVDGPHHDTKCKCFAPDFAVECVFADLDAADQGRRRAAPWLGGGAEGEEALPSDRSRRRAGTSLH